MNSYLERLAQQLVREKGEEFISQCTFVFPNRRAGLFFRKHIAAILQRPILAPKIMTINECFYSLSSLRLADPLDLLFRVYDVYRSLYSQTADAREESFDTFLFWGKLMLSDFSEIDNHLVGNVRELFTTIRDLKEVDLQFDYLSEQQKTAISEFWGDFLKSEKENADISRNFLYIWQILYPIYERLSRSLLEEGLAYDGLLHRHLLDHWDEIPEERFCRAYIFIGFNALTRSEETLMLRLQEKGIADFYFDYEHPWLRDAQNRASLFCEHNEKVFRSSIALPKTEIKLPEITHILTTSTIGETHEVYRILDTLYPADCPKSERGSLTRTAVVLPDERLLIPITHALPEQIDRINVTMGYPLSVTPTFALLKLLETMRRRTTTAGAYYKDAIAVLSHQYVQQILGDTAQELLRSIRDENRIYIRIDDPIFDAQAPTLPYLRAILARIEQKDSEELYLVETLLNRIERILATHSIDMEEATLFALITMLTGDESIPYAGEPLEGLQIMGVLETRALDFENVIITGFNDEIYPGKSQGNSFIPYILRRGFSLPTPERQDAIFAYNFYRMISYADRVWLITNARADDTHSGEASRYLAQLLYQYCLPVRKLTVTTPGKSLDCPERVVEKTPFVLAQLNDYAAVDGKRGFSPSALNAYLRCPMLFYWQTVTGIHESREVSETLEDDELGTLMHATLEHLYAPYRGQEITEAILTQLREQAPDTLKREAEKESISLTPLSSRIILHYVYEVLNHDALLVPFTYLDAERGVSTTLKLSDEREVKLRGYIDRIDRHGLRTRLIDYKSGKADGEYDNIESLFDAENTRRNKSVFQTMIYCLLAENSRDWAYERETEPHIYGVRALPYATLVHKKGETDFSWDTVREEFTEHLCSLIEEILSPDIPFRTTEDKDNTCGNCAFRALCRKQ